MGECEEAGVHVQYGIAANGKAMKGGHIYPDNGSRFSHTQNLGSEHLDL